jgi:hypothetical protein
MLIFFLAFNVVKLSLGGIDLGHLDLPLLIENGLFLLLAPYLVFAIFGGLLGIFLLGFRKKLKGFLVGFIITFIAQATYPILSHLLMPLLFPNEIAIEPIAFTNLGYYLPFILGILLSIYYLKEDYLPNIKPLAATVLVFALTFTLIKGHFYNLTNNQTTVEVVSDIPVVNSEISEAAFDERRVPKSEYEEIQFLFAQNFGIDPVELRSNPEKVRIEFIRKPEEFNHQFASGIVYSPHAPNGQNFVIGKVYAGWAIIQHATPTVRCFDIESYNPPKELIPTCTDQTGQEISR